MIKACHLSKLLFDLLSSIPLLRLTIIITAPQHIILTSKWHMAGFHDKTNPCDLTSINNQDPRNGELRFNTC